MSNTDLSRAWALQPFDALVNVAWGQSSYPLLFISWSLSTTSDLGLPPWTVTVSSNVPGFSGDGTGALGPIVPEGQSVSSDTKSKNNFWCDPPVDEFTEETEVDTIEIIDRGLYISRTVFGDITDYTRPGPGATIIPLIIDHVNGGDGSGTPPVCDFDLASDLCREASLEVFGSEDAAFPFLIEVLESHTETETTTTRTRAGQTATYLNVPRIKQLFPFFKAQNAILEVVLQFDGIGPGVALGWGASFGNEVGDNQVGLDPPGEGFPGAPPTTVTFRMNLTTGEVEVIVS